MTWIVINEADWETCYYTYTIYNIYIFFFSILGPIDKIQSNVNCLLKKK